MKRNSSSSNRASSASNCVCLLILTVLQTGNAYANDWHYEEYKDKMTDRLARTLAYSNSDSLDGKLVFSCEEKPRKMQAFLLVPGYLDYREMRDFEYRTPEGKVITMPGYHNDNMVLIRDRFIATRMAKDAKENRGDGIRFRIWSFDGDPYFLSFSNAGDKKAISNVMEVCGL